LFSIQIYLEETTSIHIGVTFAHAITTLVIHHHLVGTRWQAPSPRVVHVIGIASVGRRAFGNGVIGPIEYLPGGFIAVMVGFEDYHYGTFVGRAGGGGGMTMIVFFKCSVGGGRFGASEKIAALEL